MARSFSMISLSASTSVAALVHNGASNWWDDVNASPMWQDWIFHVLSGLFGLVPAVALIQLIRIECRVPECGWTTQKVFHFLNFLINGVRSVVFVFHQDVQLMKPEIIQHILLDMPALVFFTTYALLLLFWAEIYYQVRGVSTDELRPNFYTINVVVYAVQIALWLFIWWKHVQVVLVLSKIFFVGVVMVVVCCCYWWWCVVVVMVLGYCWCWVVVVAVDYSGVLL